MVCHRLEKFRKQINSSRPHIPGNIHDRTYQFRNHHCSGSCKFALVIYDSLDKGTYEVFSSSDQFRCRLCNLGYDLSHNFPGFCYQGIKSTVIECLLQSLDHRLGFFDDIF